MVTLSIASLLSLFLEEKKSIKKGETTLNQLTLKHLVTSRVFYEEKYTQAWSTKLVKNHIFTSLLI